MFGRVDCERRCYVIFFIVNDPTLNKFEQFLITIQRLLADTINIACLCAVVKKKH